ncbi:hypothetical protein FPV67DRAFT_874865 [Lyophyllum atratum]|nr:hypothetical protein FPV67DRAFT_874865 [Lyophyllum atratum]
MQYTCASASRAGSSTGITHTAASAASSEGSRISRANTSLPVFGGKKVEPAHYEPGNEQAEGNDTEEDEEERDKRKNTMDIEERRMQLEADQWATDVEPKQVRCRGCLRWIKLDQRSMYYRGLWDKHRDLCRGIKRLKGELIPKRKRRSKAAIALARENERGPLIQQQSKGPSTSRYVGPQDTAVRREGTSTSPAKMGDMETSPQMATSALAEEERRSLTRRRTRDTAASTPKRNRTQIHTLPAVSGDGSKVLTAPNARTLVNRNRPSPPSEQYPFAPYTRVEDEPRTGDIPLQLVNNIHSHRTCELTLSLVRRRSHLRAHWISNIIHPCVAVRLPWISEGGG